jgi:hypothetical protein
VAFNFDEFFQRFLKLFKQIIEDPNSDHPLKKYFTKQDLDNLTENPPSMEDISKMMQYFFGDPNFNPFSGQNPFSNVNIPSSPPKSNSSTQKNSQRVQAGANFITDTFEFGNEIHILIGTQRTDLEFKTGVKKSNPKDVALIIRDERGTILQVLKLPPSVDRKSKKVTYQNGTYEIIYTKKR